MSQTILITRPKDGSQILSNELAAKGYRAIVEPLFTIEVMEISIPKNSQAALITSMNAVPALLNSGVDKHIKILAVGKKTAQRLEKIGYDNVVFADGDSESLRNLALKTLSIKKGKIIYLAGDIVTLDLAEELSQVKFDTEKIISYKIIASEKLSLNTINKIKSHSIDAVMIYSQNTASIFHKLLTKHNLLEYCQSIRLLCFSDKISQHCLKLGFKEVGDIKEITN